MVRHSVAHKGAGVMIAPARSALLRVVTWAGASIMKGATDVEGWVGAGEREHLGMVS